MLEEVLKRTGAEKLTYIGHSMGCTAFFVFMSERGHQWADKINEFIGLAPVAKIK